MSRAYALKTNGADVSPASGVRRRAMAPARPISLVVVENGSSWPEGFDLASLAADCDCVLIAQQSDESPAMLADRVVRRLESIRQKGGTIERATFATAPGRSADRCDARSRVARALLASSTLTTCGAIDFVAPHRVNEEAKRDLLALAGTLLEQVGLEGPAIRVKFVLENRELPSGVRRAIPGSRKDERAPDSALVAC